MIKEKTRYVVNPMSHEERVRGRDVYLLII